MYPVAHAAIAVGAVKAAERLIPARWLPLDYRFAAVGGLLPDLIDKPLKWFLVPSLPDDHLWGHTFWFSAILIGVGLLVGLHGRDSRVLLLGLGALTHHLRSGGHGRAHVVLATVREHLRAPSGILVRFAGPGAGD